MVGALTLRTPSLQTTSSGVPGATRTAMEAPAARPTTPPVVALRTRIPHAKPLPQETRASPFAALATLGGAAAIAAPVWRATAATPAGPRTTIMDKRDSTSGLTGTANVN